MSLTNPIPRGIRQVVPDYVAAGAGPYPFPYYFVDPQDVVVFTLASPTAIPVPLAYGVNYTVAGAGLSSGGSVTLTPGISTGFIRVVGRRVPNRVTSIVNNGAIIASALEKEFDAIELTAQEARRDLDTAEGRLNADELELADHGAAISGLRTDTNSLFGRMSTAEGRLNADDGLLGGLRTDTNSLLGRMGTAEGRLHNDDLELADHGAAIAALLAGLGSSTISPVMTRPDDDHIVAPLVRRARNWRFVTDDDTITGNGTSDDWVAVQRQAEKAETNEQTLRMYDSDGSKQVILRLTDTLLSTRRLRMVGSNPPPVTNPAYPTFGPAISDQGSFLFFDHPGKGVWFKGSSNDPVHLNSVNKLMGSCFRGIGTRRRQPATNGAIGTFTPLAADYDIVVDHAIVDIDNWAITNATKGLYVTNDGKVFVGKVWGQPLNTGIYIENSYDENWLIGPIKFHPFWSQDDAVFSYTKQNAIALRTGNMSLIGGKLFALGYNIGWSVEQFRDVNNSNYDGTAVESTFDVFATDACPHPLIFGGSITTTYPSIKIGQLTGFAPNVDALYPSPGPDAAIALYGNNAELEIGKLWVGFTRGNTIFIDPAAQNNRVHVRTLEEGTYGLSAALGGAATVANIYNANVDPTKNHIDIDRYVPQRAVTQTVARFSNGVRAQLSGGVETINAGAGGAITLTHNCAPQPPTYVDVKAIAGAVQAKVTAMNGVSFTTTFYDQTGAAVASGTPITFRWRPCFDYSGAGGL